MKYIYLMVLAGCASHEPPSSPELIPEERHCDECWKLCHGDPGFVVHCADTCTYICNIERDAQ